MALRRSLQSLIGAAAALAALAVRAYTASRPDEIPFAKHAIDLGAYETCAIGDINRDGHPDIVSGENWYEGPVWTKHHFRTIEYGRNSTEDLSDLLLDVNGDGYLDVISSASHAKKLWWTENPGRSGGRWQEHLIQPYDVEFTFLVDLDNDGRAREVLPQASKKEPLAWFEVKNGAFVRHIVSDHGYGHGIGVGDLNRDGRNDILTPTGWLEAPPDPRVGKWKFHPEWDDMGKTGYLYVLDVNGDGRMDIVTSMAHDYGIFWMENLGGGQWKKHVIDDTWSQAHAVTMVDLNGDGRPDFITGKRYMAHNGEDPGEREPLGIYWYEYLRKPDGSIDWVKHIVDYSTMAGAGNQVAVADIDGDGDLDFAVGGKSGLYLFENLTRSNVRIRQAQRVRSSSGSTPWMERPLR
jgi:hypothetical protein